MILRLRSAAPTESSTCLFQRPPSIGAQGHTIVVDKSTLPVCKGLTHRPRDAVGVPQTGSDSLSSQPCCWLDIPRSPRLKAPRSTPMSTVIAQRLTAILHREEDVYVAECPEVGTVSQGDTVEEALANLREATELFLEECPQPALAPRLLTTFEVSVA